MTQIDLVVIRDGKNMMGRLLGLALGSIGRRVLEKAFEKSIQAIEDRNEKPALLGTGHSSLAA